MFPQSLYCLVAQLRNPKYLLGANLAATWMNTDAACISASMPALPVRPRWCGRRGTSRNSIAPAGGAPNRGVLGSGALLQLLVMGFHAGLLGR